MGSERGAHGLSFPEKIIQNIKMAPRGARSKLLIFDEALEFGEEEEEGQLLIS